VPLEQALLNIIACPIDKGGFLYFHDEAVLYNPRLRRRYRIRNGVPQLLAQAAENVSDAEHARLLRRAEAGDAIRTAPGSVVLSARRRNGWPGALNQYAGGGAASAEPI
jgi:uncharacterized protein YbaR (Trm112 family)